ncbi:hypothetical protein BMS3Bbin03_02113 [bacterium BMS3Bbin03]|nr:hypothetical protein BMS3Bbin03_02113 [bacterium BMS3Bbin03]
MQESEKNEAVSVSLPVVTGTQINYYFVCKRKLWLFSRQITLEHESDTVLLGKLLGQESYSRHKKEIAVDENIVIDFANPKKGIIHEVKKSRAVEKAHIFQLLYYLYYLKYKGLSNLVGELNYPLLRKKETVILTKENEMELKFVLADIEQINQSAEIPPRISKRFCRKCAYYEFCWV